MDATAEKLLGTISSVIGKATVRKADGTEKALLTGDTVQAGDQIIAEGGNIILLLSNGRIAEVSAGQSLDLGDDGVLDGLGLNSEGQAVAQLDQLIGSLVDLPSPTAGVDPVEQIIQQTEDEPPEAQPAPGAGAANGGGFGAAPLLAFGSEEVLAQFGFETTQLLAQLFPIPDDIAGIANTLPTFSTTDGIELTDQIRGDLVDNVVFVPFAVGTDSQVNSIEFTADTVTALNGAGYTSGGQDINFALIDDGQTITGTSGGTVIVEFEITTLGPLPAGGIISGAVTGTISGQFDHPAGSDSLVLPSLALLVTEADGDTTTGTIPVSIIDTDPVIGSPVEGSVSEDGYSNYFMADVINGSESQVPNLGPYTSGSLGISWMADNSDIPSIPSSFINDPFGPTNRHVEFDPALEGNSDLTSGSEIVNYRLSNDGSVLEAYTGSLNDQELDQEVSSDYRPIFTVYLNDDDSGSYEFYMHGAIDHLGGNDLELLLELGFIATDADGDTDNGSFVVRIEDSTPEPVGEIADLALDENTLVDTDPNNQSDNVTVNFTSGDNLSDIAFADPSTAGYTITVNGEVTGAGAPVISWHLVGADVVGRVGGLDAIRLSLVNNLTGKSTAVTAELLEAWPHANSTSADTISINGVQIVATDDDNDTGTAVVNVTVLDDLPTVTLVGQDDMSTTSSVEEGTAYNGGTLDIDFGADGAGEIVVSIGGVDLTPTTTGGNEYTVTGLGVLTIDPAGTWGFSASDNNVADDAQKSFEFSVTVIDSDGDTDSVSHTVVIDDDDHNPANISGSVRVSEEGLAGAIPDNSGYPDNTDDTSNSASNTGTVFFNDVDAHAASEMSVSFDVTSNLDGTVTVNNVPSISSGDVPVDTWVVVGNTLTGSASGTEVIQITLGSASAVDLVNSPGEYQAGYTVNLLQPIDHPVIDDGTGTNTGAEDVLPLQFGVVVSDGVNTTNGVIDVAVEDDMPVGGEVNHEVPVSQVNTNLMIALDTSGSMGHTIVIDGMETTRLAFGADGEGRAGKVIIDGETYTYDGNLITKSNNNPAIINGTLLSVITALGATLNIDMATGEYSYAADPDSDGQSESFNYRLVDNDGDGASGTVTFNINHKPVGEDFEVSTGSDGMASINFNDPADDHISDVEDDATGVELGILITDLPDYGSLLWDDGSGSNIRVTDNMLAGQAGEEVFAPDSLTYEADPAIDRVLVLGDTAGTGITDLDNWNLVASNQAQLIINGHTVTMTAQGGDFSVIGDTNNDGVIDANDLASHQGGGLGIGSGGEIDDPVESVAIDFNSLSPDNVVITLDGLGSYFDWDQNGSSLAKVKFVIYDAAGNRVNPEGLTITVDGSSTENIEYEDSDGDGNNDFMYVLNADGKADLSKAVSITVPADSGIEIESIVISKYSEDATTPGSFEIRGVQINTGIEDTFEYQVVDSDGSTSNGDSTVAVNTNNYAFDLLQGDDTDNNLSVSDNDPQTSDVQTSLIGLGGNDTLVGGDAIDILRGGQGDDVLTGDNPGTADGSTDYFIWEAGETGDDIIKDFHVGNDGDRLDLRELLESTDTEDDLVVAINGNDTVISYTSTAGTQTILLENTASEWTNIIDSGTTGIDGDDVIQTLVTNGQLIV